MDWPTPDKEVKDPTREPRPCRGPSPVRSRPSSSSAVSPFHCLGTHQPGRRIATPRSVAKFQVHSTRRRKVGGLLASPRSKGRRRWGDQPIQEAGSGRRRDTSARLQLSAAVSGSSYLLGRGERRRRDRDFDPAPAGPGLFPPFPLVLPFQSWGADCRSPRARPIFSCF